MTAAIGRTLWFLWRMLPFMLAVIPVAVVFRIVMISRMKKQKVRTTVSHEIGIGLLILYSAGLAAVTIVPGTVLNFQPMENISLVPFRSIIESFQILINDGGIAYFAVNFIGNIAVFVPFGLFIPLLWENFSFRKTVLISFLITVFIEIMQLPQARASDIDDVILNTAGGICGYLVYLLLLRPFPGFFSRFRTKKE